MIVSKQLIFGYEKQKQITFPDFTCPSGETLLITGKSGTGKTTLLHLLSGLLNPTSGSIQIHQTDITQLNSSDMDAFRGKNIGIVFQQSYFVESLSVWDNLQLATWLGKSDSTSAFIQQLLKELQLETAITSLLLLMEKLWLSKKFMKENILKINVYRYLFLCRRSMFT